MPWWVVVIAAVIVAETGPVIAGWLLEVRYDRKRK